MNHFRLKDYCNSPDEIIIKQVSIEEAKELTLNRFGREFKDYRATDNKGNKIDNFVLLSSRTRPAFFRLCTATEAKIYMDQLEKDLGIGTVPGQEVFPAPDTETFEASSNKVCGCTTSCDGDDKQALSIAKEQIGELREYIYDLNQEMADLKFEVFKLKNRLKALGE